MENNLKTRMNDAKGLILGKDRMGNIFEFNSNRPYNTLIIGQDGFRETPTQVLNYIFQLINRKESAIINDPNGTIFKYTASSFSENGYAVRVINPALPESSDTFNALAHSHLSDDEILAMAESIFPENPNIDRFWTLSCRNLVSGLIKYVSYNDKATKKTFDIIVDMLRTYTHNPNALYELYKDNLPYGKEFLMPVIEQNEDTLKETISRTFEEMKKFKSRADYPVFAKIGVDFKLPEVVPCAYFFVGDNASCYPINKSFLFSQAFATLTGRGLIVNFILNQFVGLGLSFDNVEKLLANAGTKMCRVLICVDTLSQIEKLYPKKYESFIAYFKIVSVNEIYDKFTEDAITETCGKKSLNMWKVETVKNPSLLKGSKNKAVAETISIQNLSKIDNNLTIIIIQGENPLLLEKYDFREHPRADMIDKRSIYNYVPYAYRGLR